MTPLETPYPYQLLGADYLAQHAQSLLGDDMGLGKSCQAVRGCDLVGAQQILVLCPGSVRVNWEREFQKFSPMDRPCQVVYTGKDHISPVGVVICSYDLLAAHAVTFKTMAWDVLVLDEAHYCKERTAKRTRAVYGHGTRSPGIITSARRCWRLTGTPAPNNASELWTHLKSAGIITDPYWDFTFRYCAGFEGSYGYQITGHKNTEELRALMANFVLRRLKADVAMDLPPIRYQEVAVEASPVDISGWGSGAQEEIRVGEQTLSQALAALRSPDAVVGLLQAEGMAMSSLRRFTGMAKAPGALAIIKEELESGQLDKIVLFAIHQAVVEGAAEALAAFGAVTVYGKTPIKQRQANIDRFSQDPSCRVLIGNITAAGVGVNGMQDSCSEVGLLEMSWVPSENAQAVARVHRNGQSKPVRVRAFSLPGSSDEQVQSALIRKIRELTKIF